MSADHMNIYRIIEKQRAAQLSGQFLDECREERWLVKYQELVAFFYLHGHSNVASESGPLGSWVSQQRTFAQKLDFPEDRRLLLKMLNFNFGNLVEYNWGQSLSDLKAFKSKHGHCQPARTVKKLGLWSQRQTQLFNNKQLSVDRWRQLAEIGFFPGSVSYEPQKKRRLVRTFIEQQIIQNFMACNLQRV